jgi:hypothetical protein
MDDRCNVEGKSPATPHVISQFHAGKIFRKKNMIPQSQT